MQSYITGIQQCGIGVCDAEEAAMYYKDLLGFTALVFDDVAEATLMTRYTGNKVEKRRALLIMNMQGGGGLELWQFLKKIPTEINRQILPGDPGIYALKIKTIDIGRALLFFKNREDVTVSSLQRNAVGEPYFWLNDKYTNLFQIVEKNELFTNTGHAVGGVCGAVIGVSHIESSLLFYKKVLGQYEVLYKNQTIKNDDSGKSLQTTLLRKIAASTGAFSTLLGGIDIELYCSADTGRTHIYTDRYWGDPGFIHLCVDVVNTTDYKADLESETYKLTVDSGVCFDMGKAGGRFGYVEDPDGTLIELVETYKVPILKKLGLFLQLKNQGIKKPLPKWIVKMLGINKVNFPNK